MIDVSQVSLCLITKDQTYPKAILDSIQQFPFGEILILTHSDSPYRKYELFEKAKFDTLAYQDDDAICDWNRLIQLSEPGMINVGMKPGHFESYKDLRMTMGLGWGSFFLKTILRNLEKYTDIYGEDELFKRDTEKILTHLVSPQNRIIIQVTDLPSATASDRLWRQPEHWSNMDVIVERCKDLI